MIEHLFWLGLGVAAGSNIMITLAATVAIVFSSVTVAFHLCKRRGKL